MVSRSCFCLLFTVVTLTVMACGGKPTANPAALYLDTTSPQSARASLDAAVLALGHVESHRFTKVMQDFQERILLAYGYADTDHPGYPHALWRELAPFDGYSFAALAQELPNAVIQGPTAEESAARLRQASAAWLERLHAPFAAYARDHEGALPPVAPVEGARFDGDGLGGRFFKVEALYPRYLDDPRLLVSPAHPQAPGLLERLDEALGDDDLTFRLRTIKAVGGDCYLYFGVALTREEEGGVFVRALNGEAVAELPPLRLDAPEAGRTPLLVERPGLQLDGSLPVLFADGAVELLPLGVWPNTVDFQRAFFANIPVDD